MLCRQTKQRKQIETNWQLNDSACYQKSHGTQFTQSLVSKGKGPLLPKQNNDVSEKIILRVWKIRKICCGMFNEFHCDRRHLSATDAKCEIDRKAEKVSKG